jgi:hypothetical protein
MISARLLALMYTDERFTTEKKNSKSAFLTKRIQKKWSQFGGALQLPVP